jgi:hypothetical protein
MHAFDDRIRLEQLPPRIAGPSDDRAVIARAGADILAQRQTAGQRGHEAVLSEIRERGLGTSLSGPMARGFHCIENHP